MFRRRLLVAQLLLIWSGLGSAQPALEEEELAQAYGGREFVSIATGTRQPLHKAPSTATVITEEDIAATGARTLSEVLESVPGMHVARNWLQNTYAPAYGMRGILTSSSPHVLMMVNGIPRTSVYLGNPDEQRVELPLENVARIEVIRGPGSAVYGADAFAGTINIITKTAADIDGSNIGLRAGSFSSWDSWFQHGGRHGDFDVAAYLKAGSSNGQHRNIAAAAGGTSGPVNTGGNDVDGQLDIAHGKLRWRAGYTLRDDVGIGLGIAGAVDPVGRVRSERISTDLSWSDANFARDLSLTLQAAYMQLTNEVTTPLRLYPAGSDFTAFGGSVFPDGVIGQPDKSERQYRLSASSVYSGFEDHRLRFGFGHDELEIYKTSDLKNFSTLTGVPVALPELTAASGAELYLAPHRRRIDYVYAQDEWSFARDWTLTGGLRHDRYSDFGSTTNPRLALVWEARHDLTAKLMYGTAFRAPSFVELYAGGNPIAQGNPGLKPEKISTLEAVLAWQAKHNLNLTLSLFHHQISDIIRQTTPSYYNAGKQHGSGGELEVRWQASDDLRLLGHYAYQKNIDEQTGQDAGYAPHHHLYLRSDWRVAPGWQLSGQANYVADRQRAAGDTRPPIADYTTVDLTLRSEQKRPGWDFSFSIRNLFDADVREPASTSYGIIYDYPMPGRTFWAQARYSL